MSKGYRKLQGAEFEAAIHRALVHDYGFTVVQAFLDIGVHEPRHIKHLVETVLNEFSPTRGAASLQGPYRDPGMRLDKTTSFP